MQAKYIVVVTTIGPFQDRADTDSLKYLPKDQIHLIEDASLRYRRVTV